MNEDRYEVEKFSDIDGYAARVVDNRRSGEFVICDSPTVADAELICGTLNAHEETRL